MEQTTNFLKTILKRIMPLARFEGKFPGGFRAHLRYTLTNRFNEVVGTLLMPVVNIYDFVVAPTDVRDPRLPKE